MSIKINLEQILKQKNQSVYLLSKQTGVSQMSLAGIIKNKTTSIRFDVLNAILNALECKIEDVIIHTPDGK